MSKFLEAITARIKTVDTNVIRVAEIHGDGEPEVVELRPATPCQNIYSVSKAFTLTAVGFLVDEGKLSVDEIVTDVLGSLCPKTYHPLWDKTTVKMLMQHQVGLTTCGLDIDCEDSRNFGDDFLFYAMNAPLSEDHGVAQHYTDAAIYMLSCCIEARAGMALDNYLWKKLFRPLGFRDAAWSHCPMGHAMGATGLYIRTEDMAKLGALYMHGGMWKGKRLLSEAWCNGIHENKYDLRPFGIGNTYGKHGMLGQTLYVIPDAQRVVAWQSATDLGLDKLDLCGFSAAFRD